VYKSVQQNIFNLYVYCILLDTYIRDLNGKLVFLYLLVQPYISQTLISLNIKHLEIINSKEAN